MLSEYQKKNLAQGKDNTPVEAPQASASKNLPQQVSKKPKKTPQDQSEGQAKVKGTGKAQVEQALPSELQSSKEREDSHGKCVQYGKNFDGIQNQGRGKIEPIFPIEIDLVKLVLNLNLAIKKL
ncbi:hypothetical protein O181_097143 [Austropuccinia psidii MF-1]|uniref:Uncharacterized protein n=1 Tax=Austropuccinia psidii MF-1 TaxID=1389203 RepID=A0A9Q3J8C0_9BASI|nr:hypothetical protein [Austropuccinia psidii MF-1]